MIKLDKNSKVSIPIKPYIVENVSGKEVEIVEKPKENTKRTRDNSVVIDRQVLPNGIEMIKVPGEKSVRIDMMKANPINEKSVVDHEADQQQPKKSKEFGILHNGIGKKQALKIYDQFTLKTSCFWGSTRSNIPPIEQFHEIFVTKIINRGDGTDFV